MPRPYHPAPRSRLIAALVSLAAACSALATPALQPPETLRAAARAHLEAHHASGAGSVEIAVGRVDPRLRLARCEQGLETFLPNAGRDVGRVAVGVRCPDRPGWTLYVTASVRLMRPVVVLARSRSRGAVLGPADVRVETRDVSRLARGYASATEEVLGKQLVRPATPGYVLGPRDVEAPRLIRRGDRVSVLAAAAGIEIRSEAEALEDGTAGAVISVRNLRSKRVVDAVVTGAATVEVRL